MWLRNGLYLSGLTLLSNRQYLQEGLHHQLLDHRIQVGKLHCYKLCQMYWQVRYFLLGLLSYFFHLWQILQLKTHYLVEDLICYLWKSRCKFLIGRFNLVKLRKMHGLSWIRQLRRLVSFARRNIMIQTT